MRDLRDILLVEGPLEISPVELVDRKVPDRKGGSQGNFVVFYNVLDGILVFHTFRCRKAFFRWDHFT